MPLVASSMQMIMGPHRSCGGVQAKPGQRGPPRCLGEELVREVAEIHAEVNAAVHSDAVQRDITARILKGVHMVEAEEGAALKGHLLAAFCDSTFTTVSIDQSTIQVASHGFHLLKQVRHRSVRSHNPARPPTLQVERTA